MPHDPDDLVDAKETMGEISWPDLILILIAMLIFIPIAIISIIFIFILLFVLIIFRIYYYPDLPTHSINNLEEIELTIDSTPVEVPLECENKLEETEHEVDSIPTNLKAVEKEFYKIELKITEKTRFELITTTVCEYDPSSTQYDNFDEVMQEFRRFSLNTKKFEIDITFMSSEQIDRIFDALSDFEADELQVWNGSRTQLTLSILLSFTQKFREIWIDGKTNLTAQDLCTLRKTILEGGCKLENVFFLVDEQVIESLLEELFGVTIEDDKNAHTKIYRTTDESIELYRDGSGLCHFQGSICTRIGNSLFDMKKCEIDEKTNEKYEKIKFNHPY